jgi:hypothetical protein
MAKHIVANFLKHMMAEAERTGDCTVGGDIREKLSV